MTSRGLRRELLPASALAGLLTVLAVAIIWLPVWLGDGQAGSSAAELVLPCRERNLGTVRQGTVLRAAFPIKNSGHRRLIVVAVDGMCCGQAEDPGQMILAPGEQKELIVEVDTSLWQGRLRHTAQFTTNDPQVPSFDLHVRAVVDLATAAEQSPLGKLIPEPSPLLRR